MADHEQPTHEVTRILEAIQDGDLKAANELLPTHRSSQPGPHC